MDVITYSLRNDSGKSDPYYRDIATFTDEVLAGAELAVGGLVDGYKDFLLKTDHEFPRSSAEYIFEIIMLGVFWRVYHASARHLGEATRRTLIHLTHLKSRGAAAEWVAKRLTGVIVTIFLSSSENGDVKPPAPTLTGLDRLLNWLEATGDFTQEVRRLRPWIEFLRDQPPQVIPSSLADILTLAGWFEERSLKVLGRYTPNVECFLRETHPRYRWREDLIFCGRRRVEYHLNMLGTEILNRAFRESFLRTKQRFVLVPPCMTHPDEACQSRQTSFGARCAACSPGCRVNQLTKLGEKYGFQVFMLPDQLKVFSGKKPDPEHLDEMGIVGVSCALTNVSGGWDTRAMGIPAQGVLLDYCGCPWHWHKQGIPTDTNFAQIMRVLGITAPFTAGV